VKTELKLGYKQTEIGVIPEDWEALILGNVIRFQRGFDLPHRLRRAGKIPIISSSGICGLHDQLQAVAPGVVTGRYGTIGEVFFIEEDYWPLNTALFVKEFKGNDPRFISFLLRTIDFHSHSGKSGVPGVNRNDLHELMIALPPYKEQCAIATGLSDMDTLITALDKLITKKRSIKQGAMQQLLTGKKRLPGFSGKWEVKSFGEIFDYQPTATNSRSDLIDDGDSYYIHYGDIHTRFHSHLDFRVDQPPRIHRSKCSNAMLLKNGDWVLADASEDFDGVGKSIEILGLEEGITAVAGLHTFLLREKNLTFAPGFKGHLGNLKSLHDEFLRVATGMKVYGVSKTALRNLLLTIPKLDEQTAIATILSDMDAEISAIEARRDKTKAIKQGMMQTLLSGRVRLI
jgi:type I restriction enzyme S subunit